jgi:hypothetical protein
LGPTSPIVPTRTVSAMTSVETPEIGRDAGLRPNADLRPVERSRRHGVHERRDRRHLALQLAAVAIATAWSGPGHDELQPALAVLLEPPGADIGDLAQHSPIAFSTCP